MYLLKQHQWGQIQQEWWKKGDLIKNNFPCFNDDQTTTGSQRRVLFICE